MTLPEADVREADPDLADDRARPRALHPLLPLHALLLGRRRGRPARRAQPRRAVDDHDLRGRAVPRAVLRQRDRALPGRRAHLDAVPLRGAAVGDPERADRLRRSARSAATSRRRRARARSSGSSRATTPRSTRAGSATRAASRSRTSTRTTGSPSRSGASRRRGFDAGLVGRRARRGRAAAARRRGADRDRALRLGDGRAAPTRSASCCGRGSARTRRCCPEATTTALDAFRAAALRDRRRASSSSSSATTRSPSARRSSTSGSSAARRNGAEVVTIGPAELDRSPAPQRAAASSARRRARQRLRLRARVLIWSGAAAAAARAWRSSRSELGFDGKPGSGAFHLPATPNGARRRRRLGRAPPTSEAENPEPIGLLIVSGDEAAADPAVRALAEHAEAVIAITMFQGLAVGWADLVLPGTSYLERDGTTSTSRAALQRLRRAVIPPVPGRARVDLEARRALRRRALAVPGGRLRRALGAALRRARVRRGRRARAAAARAHARRRRARAAGAPSPRAGARRRALPRNLACSATGRSSPARPSSACPSSQFQRPAAEVELAADDAERREHRDRRQVVVRSNGTSRRAARARQPRSCSTGVARIAEEHAADLHRDVEVSEARDRAVVDLGHQGGGHHQPRAASPSPT